VVYFDDRTLPTSAALFTDTSNSEESPTAATATVLIGLIITDSNLIQIWHLKAK
jgi:hypothetical protein